MPDSPLDTYLASVDPVAAPVVTALHEAVVAAAPQLDVAIKYTLLSYAIEGD